MIIWYVIFNDMIWYDSDPHILSNRLLHCSNNYEAMLCYLKYVDHNIT